MRRKSTRNTQKATPDKPAKEAESKIRRSKRRKRSPSKSSDSDEDVPLSLAKQQEETPDTTTKSHTPSDEETEEPVWKVTSSEDANQGEIHKLKICLTRPSPDSPEKTKTRRSKSSSQTEDEGVSSEDKSTRRSRTRRSDALSGQDGREDEDVEEKKGKGKSKGKHKSKIDKSPRLSEPEIQTNNDISENAQVTPQSPSIVKPVDNENDYNKVDDNIVNETVGEQDIASEEVSSVAHEQNVSDLKDTAKSSDDDEPLSEIQKIVNSETEQEQCLPQTAATEETRESIIITLEETNDVQTEVIIESIETEPSSHIIISSDEIIEQKQESSEETNDLAEVPESAVVSEPEQVPEPAQILECVEEEIPEPTQIIECVEESEPMQISEIVEESQEKASPEIDITQESIPEPESQQSTPEASTQQEVDESSLADESEAYRRSKSSEKSVEKSDSSPAEALEQIPSTSGVQEQPAKKERSCRLVLKRDNEHLTRDEKSETDPSCPVRPSKIKRKWERDSGLITSLVKIDLDTIQLVCPTISFSEEPDLHLELEKERRKSLTETPARKPIERKVSVEYQSDSSEKPVFEKQNSSNSISQEAEDNSNIIAFNRKISIVDDTASKLRPPPSPARNPLSNVLYITNLVRPFTLKQLKELLQRTGKVQEEGFWTDRIKSKCYVQYESAEEAEATRNALHGVQWPIGNGKNLIIDYATVEDLNNAKNPPPPPAPAPPPEPKVSVKENLEPVEPKSRHEEKPSKDVEKKRHDGHVREWDIGKKDVRRDRNRSRSRDRSRKHRRTPSPSEDFISRKQRKAEENVPQKLMDDLFLKTKATPSIYWQPLSPEEISMKQQQRLIRMEEHKRRMEENSRMKGRETGRGAFRRRYD